MSLPPESNDIPLVAAYIDTDNTVLSQAATLYLPLPSGIGNQATLKAHAFQRLADQDIAVDSTVVFEAETGLAILSGVTQTGYYFISLERK